MYITGIGISTLFVIQYAEGDGQLDFYDSKSKGMLAIDLGIS